MLNKQEPGLYKSETSQFEKTLNQDSCSTASGGTVQLFIKTSEKVNGGSIESHRWFFLEIKMSLIDPLIKTKGPLGSLRIWSVSQLHEAEIEVMWKRFVGVFF